MYPRSDRQRNFTLEGITTEQVLQVVEMNRKGDFGIPVPDYTDENVSNKVVKIIQSYTGIVDRTVWRKY